MIIKILVSIILTLNFTLQQQQQSNFKSILNLGFMNEHSFDKITDKEDTSNDKNRIKLKQIKNYYLKWITNDYLFPVWIEKNLTIDADYKWYKYSEGVFIDEIDDHSSQYLSSQTADKTILYLLTYNYTTHEQLSTYEPRIVAIRSDPNDSSDLFSQATDISNDYFYSSSSILNSAVIAGGGTTTTATLSRDIFTLAYLKSHTINITRVNSKKIELSCQVNIMLPINDDYLNEKNYQLIQKYLYLKMAISPHLMQQSHKISKNHHHHNKRRLKRSLNEDYASEHKIVHRKIPNSFIEFELKEGPIQIYIDNSNKIDDDIISCTIGLVEWDDTLIYENTINRSVFITDEEFSQLNNNLNRININNLNDDYSKSKNDGSISPYSSSSSSASSSNKSYSNKLNGNHQKYVSTRFMLTNATSRIISLNYFTFIFIILFSCQFIMAEE
jgi:hypothetical protein